MFFNLYPKLIRSLSKAKRCLSYVGTNLVRAPLTNLWKKLLQLGDKIMDLIIGDIP